MALSGVIWMIFLMLVTNASAVTESLQWLTHVEMILMDVNGVIVLGSGGMKLME